MCRLVDLLGVFSWSVRWSAAWLVGGSWLGSVGRSARVGFMESIEVGWSPRVGVGVGLDRLFGVG